MARNEAEQAALALGVRLREREIYLEVSEKKLGSLHCIKI